MNESSYISVPGRYCSTCVVCTVLRMFECRYETVCMCCLYAVRNKLAMTMDKGMVARFKPEFYDAQTL